ncbi:MAG: hypothetical protein ACXWLA_06055, partial [Myxococcaceae bacterium]
MALLAPLLGLPVPEEPAARDVSAPQGPAPEIGDQPPWLRVREVESTYEVWASPSTRWETGCRPPDPRIVPVFRAGRAFGLALRIQPGSPAR